jgi:hypothetical protein
VAVAEVITKEQVLGVVVTGEALLQEATHKVDILVTGMKVMVLRAQVVQVATLQDTEVQTDLEEWLL